jgi:hypothetical protein
VAAVVRARRADDELCRIECAAVLAADRVLDDEAVANEIPLVDDLDAEQQLPADLVLSERRDACACGRNDARDVRVTRRVALQLLDRADVALGRRNAGADELNSGVADHRDGLDDRRLVAVEMEDLEAVGEHRPDWQRRLPPVRVRIRERLAVERRSIGAPRGDDRECDRRHGCARAQAHALIS